MTDTSNIQEIREAFERTNSRDHRRQPPNGNNYIDPMAQADWESFQKGWQASRHSIQVTLPRLSFYIGHNVPGSVDYLDHLRNTLEAAGVEVRP